MVLALDSKTLQADSLAATIDKPNKVLSLLFDSQVFNTKQADQTLLLRLYRDDEVHTKNLERARKGGLAVKTDALSEWIKELVVERPKITAHRLEQLVKQQVSHGLIYSIKGDIIEFYDKNDKIKQAKLSGLKDRLSRAKINRAKRSSRDRTE